MTCGSIICSNRVTILRQSWCHKIKYRNVKDQIYHSTSVFIKVAHGCHIAQNVLINPLWHSDAKWRHKSGSTLAHNGPFLTSPSHYLNQFWFVMNEVLWYSFTWENFVRECPRYYPANAFEQWVSLSQTSYGSWDLTTRVLGYASYPRLGTRDAYSYWGRWHSMGNHT